MTSTYDSRGRRVGATILQITPNFVTQIKTVETKDGYNAVQLGTGTKKSVKKPQLGLGKKIGVEKPIKWFREVRIEGEAESVKGEVENIKPGTEIKLNQVFSIGDAIKVSATSKGKGFQGGMRRHGFHGGARTHGQSDRERAPGSIGSGTTPGRVYKGKRMAGHMGSEQVTTRNLEIVGMDKENNLLVIKGAIPGPTGGLVTITKLGRVKGYTPPPEEKPSEEELAEAEAEAVKDQEEVTAMADQPGSEDQQESAKSESQPNASDLADNAETPITEVAESTDTAEVPKAEGDQNAS